MDKTTGAILVVIGVVALFAAIVGGGIKIKEIEVGSVPSLWRQGLLGLFGIVVAVTGAVFMSESGTEDNSNKTEIAAENTQGADQGGVANRDDSSGNDTNIVEPNAGPDANATETAPETNTGG